MYLKNIEINGFKSFANKITFEFPHGITGIVGPNGSGKSNIGDAVRWVLGEQSAKQLRGSRMEDVIFSGTETRKPLGFAYVAITFENSDRKIALDYDEIKVARRVYRSGESEYLLNGSVCRRRQIIDLFYDTGIGKEGYSIIGQGQVEKILSGKLEDSRELFDEAAGIAKYKKDRNLTEKSLEKARDDLERVSDILNELEKQVGPLERQSEKAKKYLHLRDREKEIDIQLFLRDYENAKAEKEKTEKDLAITKDHLEATQEAYQKKKEKNVSISEKATQYTKEADEKEQKMSEYQKEKSVCERSLLEIQHEVDKNILLKEQYVRNIEQAQNDIQQRKEQILEEENVRKEEQAVLADCENAMKLLEIDRQKLSEEILHLEREKTKEQEHLLDLLSSRSDLKEKLSRIDTLEEQLAIRNAEYSSRYLMLQTEISDYQKKAQKLQDEWEKCQKENESYQKELEGTNQQIKKKEENRKELSKVMEESNQTYLRARSQYETLTNLTERYEGYNRSIQHVMEQKKHNPGIIGVVADLITLDQRYENAIEIALGGALQNIVTEDEQVAKKMIRFLKERRYGRATFLPLTSIRKRNIGMNPAILEEEGVVGLASSLVTTDSRYRNLMESLLGKTVVAENIDVALYLSRKYNFSLRIVTIDGELLNPGGAITGGAFRNNSNLLGRHRELEECKNTMRKEKEIYQNAKEERMLLQVDLNDLREKALMQKECLDASVFHFHEVERQITERKEKEQGLEERLKGLKKEHAILKEQLEEIKLQKTQLSEDKTSEQEITEENQDIIGGIEEKIALKNEKSDELFEEYSKLMLKQSQTKQKIDFINKTILRLKEEISTLEETIQDIKKSQNQMLLENQKYEEQLLEKNRELKQIEKKIEILKVSMDLLKESRGKITEELNQSFKELEEENETLRVLERNETKLTSRLENLVKELETVTNYMWENYEITYNYALPMKKETLTKDEIEKWRSEKKSIRQMIKELGPVNVGAIEEFKEVGERYSFMKEQYEDIKASEEKLLTLIEEFNTQMKAQFQEKFKDIKMMFMEVFSNLFEGGTASLELMDESNILECGIRIIAQPPGKKLQNIMLLSGGERALTAIALLFAIQNLKPSPFCLLDEIEAALDDANILRFSKYLKELSKDTQFIVITHRRGTMRAADVLYGITMQEKGISTLISVDLIDKELS